MAQNIFSQLAQQTLSTATAPAGGGAAGDDDPTSAITAVAQEHGVNPNFLLGLAQLETRGGKATVKGQGVDSRNLFNIKDFSKAGTGIRALDKAEGSNDPYRRYDSASDSARDLVRLLGSKRYEGALTAQTPEEFAAALKRGGYATDPDHDKKVIATIRSIEAKGGTPAPAPAQPWDQGARYVPMEHMVPGGPPAHNPNKNPDFLRGAGDVALSFLQGAAGSVKSVTDLAGAGNAVSRGLDDVSKGLGQLKSEEAQQSLAYHQQKIKDAEANGDWKQEMGAYADMVWDMPADSLAQALGSLVTLGVGKAAQVVKLASSARRAGMTKEAFLKTAQGVEAAKKASNLGAGVNLGLGVGQGVGGVKGEQYERTYNAAKEEGLADDEAQALATEAQSYGKGWMQQAAGAALGYAAAKTGPLEKLASGQTVGAGGVLRRLAGGTGIEGATEGLQGGQARYAGNTAAIDAGVLDESQRFAGVAGTAFSEGLLGGVVGGGAGALGHPDVDPLAATKEAAKKPDSPISRAAVASQPTKPEQPSAQAPVTAGAGAQSQEADPTFAEMSDSVLLQLQRSLQERQAAGDEDITDDEIELAQAAKAEYERRMASAPPTAPDPEPAPVAQQPAHPAAPAQPAGVFVSEEVQPAPAKAQPAITVDLNPAPRAPSPFDAVPLEQDPAITQQQREDAAKVQERRSKRMAALRLGAYNKNPMMEFLGRHGLQPETQNEFAPGTTERRKAAVYGYGPVFRQNGKPLDLLLSNAQDEGFLPPEASESDLYDLVARAINGERVEPLYKAGSADALMQRLAAEREAKEAASYEDFLAQQQALAEDPDYDPFATFADTENDYDVSDLDNSGYSQAEKSLQAEVSALAQAYSQLGFDADDVLEPLAIQYESNPDEYYAQARQRLTQLITQAAQPRSNGNLPQDSGEQTQAPIGREAANATSADDDALIDYAIEDDGEPDYFLQAQTARQLREREEAIAEQARLNAERQQALEAKAQADDERKRIEQASVQAADTFELGQNALDNLTGQADLLAQMPAANSDKPRLAESGDDLVAKLKELSGGAVTQAGVRPVSIRVPGMPGEFQMRADGTIEKIVRDGTATAKASPDEVRGVEEAIANDRVQVMTMSGWGGSGPAKETASKQTAILHSPGMSWGQTPAQPQDGDILSDNGQPFTFEYGAKLRAKKEGGEVVKVAGGWAVRPKQGEATQADPVAGDKINDEWTAFSAQSGTLGIPRAEMPQVKAQDRGAMVNFLKARGIDSSNEVMPARAIKPTQAEFSPAKVQEAANRQDGERSIIVSADGYVVDGHHQWMAQRQKGEPVNVIKLDQPIGDVLQALKGMPSAQPEQARDGATRAQQVQATTQDVAPQTTQEQQDAILTNSLPTDTAFKPGKGKAGTGKWIASAGDVSGNLSDSIADAAKSLAQFINAERERTDKDAERKALAESVALKLKSGEQPTDVELRNLFGLEPGQSYVDQAAVGSFLVEYMGVPRNKIRESLGVAASSYTTDTGTKYPTVLPRKLHLAFGAAAVPEVGASAQVPPKWKKLMDTKAEEGNADFLDSVVQNNATKNPHVSAYAQGLLDKVKAKDTPKFAAGDQVRINGEDQKLHTIDQIGKDGWVYLKSGGAFPPEKAAEYLFKSEPRPSNATFGGSISSPEDRAPSYAENMSRWRNEAGTSSTSQTDTANRADSGGQVGMNGYFYKGGQFLPNTMAEPGKWKLGGKWVTGGREETAPNQFGYTPTPFSRSIYSMVRGWLIMQDGKLALRDGIRENDGSTPVTLNTEVRPGVRGVIGKESLTVAELIDAWNSGQRWFDVKPDTETITTQTEPQAQQPTQPTIDTSPKAKWRNNWGEAKRTAEILGLPIKNADGRNLRLPQMVPAIEAKLAEQQTAMPEVALDANRKERDAAKQSQDAPDWWKDRNEDERRLLIAVMNRQHGNVFANATTSWDSLSSEQKAFVSQKYNQYVSGKATITPGEIAKAIKKGPQPQQATAATRQQAAPTQPDTPLARAEAELADWKARRNLPANAGNVADVDKEINRLEQTVVALKQVEGAGKIGAGNATAEKLRNLFRIALSRKDGNKDFADIGVVSSEVSAKITEATGLNLTGYMHSIDESSVRHIMKQHGNAEKEAARGQVAITEDDITLIPEIVASPDEVIKGEANSNGGDSVIFKKKMGDAYVYVQEVRDGRKKLAAKTLWKVQIAPPAATKVGEAHTSETLDRNLSTGNNSLPSSSTDSKPDYGANNKLVTADRAAEIRAKLKAKLNQLNSGIDPEIVALGTELAVFHIEAGVRKFADFAKAIAADLDMPLQKLRPFLRGWYNGARDIMEDSGVSIDGTDGPDAVRAALREIDNAVPIEPQQENANDADESQGNNQIYVEGSAPSAIPADGQQRRVGAVPSEPDRAVPRERVGGAASGAEPDGGRTGAGQRPADDLPGDRERSAQSDGRTGQLASDYRIRPGELKRTGSWKATAEQNVRIVELVKQITVEGRQATAEEKALLTKFTGWGASEIANGIFPNQYGNYKPDWRELGERLKAALTPEEYAQAKRTTQYAHYTSEPIIRSVYSALDRMGFNGGEVLEPGMGVGLFNGLMPDAMASNSQYTGIEYDSITGNIARLLYPASNIVVGDFTATKFPRDFFDAAIGNPPFGQIKIQSDPEYKKQGFLLHDYFFAKTIDRVKPGGLLVFVTSKGTMDKATDRARKYLSERADLVGAIRLPQTAFKDNAGTEVVTDVIFLKKRAEGQETAGQAWQGLAEVQTAQGPAYVNEYFAAHPEMVLGRHAKTGSMYRADEYTVEPIEGDIEQLFAKAVQNLPENIYRPQRGSKAERAAVQRRDYDPKIKKEGGIYVADDGALMQVNSGQGVPLTSRENSAGKVLQLKPREIEWLKGYAGVRDALKQAQYDQLNDGPWEKSLKALNKAYDAFTKEHGPILAHTISERENDDGSVTVTRRFKNEPLIRLDAEGALVHALESINADGTISKGVALNGRTVNKPITPTITNAQDAMFVSLNETGRFDMADIAKLAGKTEAEVIAELGTAIYEDPGAGWTTADAYLSGNVVRKLKEAESAARIDKRYERNVEALKHVQPRALAPQDITVQLGSAWIPATDVMNFAAEVMGDTLQVSYSPVTGQWSVDGNSSRVSEWGTGDKKPTDILEGVLNNRQLKVTYRDSEGKTHTDAEATEKVNDIAKKLRGEFKRWVWSDTQRADRLAKFYNENYNNIAPRQFDGSHLTLPGVSSRFNLRPHQKRAIWRTIQQGDTYYAHAVGAGKTFTMIAAGMEERRLGLAKKPMYVVPNHMLAQFSKEFLELYPTASIMVADETNFHTHNRRKFVAQAALNDPDAIVITHSAFGRIGMSPEYTQQFIEGQIGEWKDALDESDKNDRVTRKQIERRIEQLENRLKGIIDGKKDQLLSFEELGVDRLYVDEGHEFRKLDFPTNRGNIKGIDPSGSQRSMDLYMKVQYLRQKNPSRALVMASGTPVTNTMGELFTVQRFFQPTQLEEDGDDSFDAWANHYGEVVDGLEQNAAGGYETVSRFAKFVNVPELMSRVRTFMDILTSNQLGDLVQRPDVNGGGRKVVVTPVPDGYKAYQKQLDARIKAIRNRKGPPQPGDDIILSVISDGRFSAIDMRFVDPALPSDPNSKLNVTIDEMIRAYKDSQSNEYATGGKADELKGGSLMLFTDIGLGEQSAKSRGFDMKAWIEKRLVEGGVKPEHIAFMRDHKAHAKKERLFEDMRQGRKRILIGGKDMETGVNAQKRLVWLGHLDAPWFPASVEQREGRIIRQGNQNRAVDVKAFATKGSYDSTMWGMNSRKARFIEQAMSGDTSVRSMEDVSEASAFEMAAALASGDERYMKLAGLKADVERLNRLYSAHMDDQKRLRGEKMTAESSIKYNREQIDQINAALAKREPVKAGEFRAQVGGVTFGKREEFSVALYGKFKELAEAYTDGEQQLGGIGGFPIRYLGMKLRDGNFIAELSLDLPGDNEPLAVFPTEVEFSVAGIATRAANQVNGLERELAKKGSFLSEQAARLEKINRRLGATFPEQSELNEKREALDELEKELEAESKANEAAQAQSNDVPTEGATAFSRTAKKASDELNALHELSENDDLFALPASSSLTVAGIAADIDPTITVSAVTPDPGQLQKFKLTMPGGDVGYLYVRRPNPYGATLYAYDLEDGQMVNMVEERPGTNPDDVPYNMEDVYIDVSKLKEGGGGSKVYAIAGAYAHNTGRMFIGDPAGLSDEAMRRRPEAMLSLALKYGTTDFLAPHPRQMQGDAKLGIPALDWVYGDTIGNIERLVALNVQSLDNAFPDAAKIDFDERTGQYFNIQTGSPVDRDRLVGYASALRGRVGNPLQKAVAGGRTVARGAVWRALLRKRGSENGGVGRERNGLLAALAKLGSNTPKAVRQLFSRGADSGQSDLKIQQIQAVVRQLQSGWNNAPAVVVVQDLQDPRVPQAVRDENARQVAAGAEGAPEGFIHGETVYLVANQMGSPADVARVLLHETLGHYGLRGVFGDTLSPILRDLANKRRREVVTMAIRQGLKPDTVADNASVADIYQAMTPAQREQAAEEVLAYMAQNQPELGFVQRAVAAIRKWLKSTFPALGERLALTDGDIVSNYILPARAFVESGRPRVQAHRTAKAQSNLMDVLAALDESGVVDINC